jgi:hypothetical protein
LTTALPILNKRPHAQVAELVDALASGASGLTAVKVRVLSWAPIGRPMFLRSEFALRVCALDRNRALASLTFGR